LITAYQTTDAVRPAPSSLKLLKTSSSLFPLTNLFPAYLLSGYPLSNLRSQPAAAKTVIAAAAGQRVEEVPTHRRPRPWAGGGSGQCKACRLGYVKRSAEES
jgi:hypothetical protein